MAALALRHCTRAEPAEPASLTLTNSFGVSEVLLGLRVWLQLLTLIADVDPFVFHDLLRVREIGVRRDQNCDMSGTPHRVYHPQTRAC